MKRVLLGAAVGVALVLNAPAAHAAYGNQLIKMIGTCDEGSEDCGWCARYGDTRIVCTP